MRHGSDGARRLGGDHHGAGCGTGDSGHGFLRYAGSFRFPVRFARSSLSTPPTFPPLETIKRRKFAGVK
jgi:hypothetical protein